MSTMTGFISKTIALAAVFVCAACAPTVQGDAPPASGCSCPKESHESCSHCPHCTAGKSCGGKGDQPTSCGHAAQEGESSGSDKKEGCFGRTNAPSSCHGKH